MLNTIPYEEWLVKRKDEVLQYALSEVIRRAATPQQGELLEKAIRECPDFIDPKWAYHPYIHLPLLVYAGVHGSDEPAIGVSAVCLLVRIGSKLYDDLTDGDLPEVWKGHRDFEVINIATAIACVIPPSIVAELDILPERQKRMQGLLAQGILQMLAGQERDLAYKSEDDISAEAVLASVVGKSGMGAALAAGLAAEMAGADEEVVEAYTDFGRVLGTMGLLACDFREMFFEPWCRDLAQGTRTLQIALCLEQMSTTEREDFLEDLARARTDAAAQEQVRNTLRKPRFLFPLTKVGKRLKVEAETALSTANPADPARKFLFDLLAFGIRGI